MFRGSSFNTVDPKGRLIIPARFRDIIKADGDGVMISKLDHGLFAYTLEGWKDIERKIIAMVEEGSNLRRFRRVFVGSASYCSCDKQGRILIPPPLRDYAGIEKEVVLVGVLDHFEIWSRENWEKENLQLEDDMERVDVSNEIAKLGL